MFSMTTMASSMSMPIDSDRASIVRLLSVKPMACMNAKVAMTLVGSARAAMNVARRVAQEEHDDDDGEHRAEDEVLAHGVDRALGEDRRVLHHREP